MHVIGLSMSTTPNDHLTGVTQKISCAQYTQPEPKLNTLRERTVNWYAMAEELEILRENLRQQSSAAVESDVLISQDSTDFSLLPTMSKARNEKTRKRKQNITDAYTI